MLSDKQLKQIRNIIKDHYQVILRITTGAGNPSKQLLKKLGINDKDPSMLDCAFILGKLVQKVGINALKKMNLADIKKQVNKVKLSVIEKNSLRYAKQKAGDYVTGLGNKSDSKILQMLLKHNYHQSFAEAEKEIVNQTVAHAIKNQYTKGQLKTELGHSVGEWKRDWQRVAHTELWNAKLNGECTTILQGESIYSNTQKGDTIVSKRPAPDACKKCIELYIDKATGKPKKFKLSELMGKSNVGKKVGDWEATLECVHPNCACVLIVVPDGFDFDDDWNLVYVGGDV